MVSFGVMLAGSVVATIMLFFATNDTELQGPPVKTCQCDCKRVDCVPGVSMRGLPADLDKMTVAKARKLLSPAVPAMSSNYLAWMDGADIRAAAGKVAVPDGAKHKVLERDFAPMYQKTLQPFRDTGLEYRVLELGLNSGHTYSLLQNYAENLVYKCMEKDAAKLSGVADLAGLDAGAKAYLKDNCVQGSPASNDDLLKVNVNHGPFDIVIDDGSHSPAEQVSTFMTLFPKLSPSGSYIVEDLQGSFAPKLGGTLAVQKQRGTMVDLIKDLHIALQFDWWKADGVQKVAGPFTLHESLAEWIQSIDCDREICVIRKRHKSIRKM